MRSNRGYHVTQSLLHRALHGDGSKHINIRIFYQHRLVNKMATSAEVVSSALA